MHKMIVEKLKIWKQQWSRHGRGRFREYDFIISL